MLKFDLAILIANQSSITHLFKDEYSFYKGIIQLSRKAFYGDSLIPCPPQNGA